MKKIYFNKNSDEVKEMFQLEEKKKKTHNTILGSSTIESKGITSNEKEDTNDVLVDEIINGLNKNVQKLEYVKVKIIITEIAKDNNKKFLRKLLSPIATTFKKQPEFGMYIII